jgi:hypothetical protein
MKDTFPILKRLGPIPFWRGQDKCMGELDKMYTRSSAKAKKILQGELKPKD